MKNENFTSKTVQHAKLNMHETTERVYMVNMNTYVRFGLITYVKFGLFAI